MTIKTFAAVAAVFGAVASYGADLGRYMLPDADVVAACTGDCVKKGAYTRELEKAVNAEFGAKQEEMLAELAEAMGPDGKKGVQRLMDYIGLLTNGVKRVEYAVSVKANPKRKDCPVAVSLAAEGIVNAEKILKKLAADFPEVCRLDGGALVPAEGLGADGMAKAWVESGILRVIVGNAPEKPAAVSPFPPDSLFGKLLKAVKGTNYGGVRVKNVNGIIRRFESPESVERMAQDPTVGDLVKLGDVGFDASESATAPLLDMSAFMKFDTAETAGNVAEKLIGLKQMALAAIQEGAADVGPEEAELVPFVEKIVKSIKIASAGNEVQVRLQLDARDHVALIKKAAKLK